MKPGQRTFEFDGFRVDLENHILFKGLEPVALTPKAFDTLAVLVSRHGEVLAKEELLKLVWPGVFVEEANLTQNIYTLRKAFSEAGAPRSYIETIPKRGYRFVGEVQEISAPPAPAAPPLESPPAPARPKEAGTRRPGRLALAAGAALLSVLAGLAAWRLGRPSGDSGAGAPGPGEVTSIAVLPFEPLNPRPEDAYLGLGMADALITRLSNLHQLIVRPTSAVRRYAEVDRDPVKVGRELKVDAVLDGTLQRSGDTLRVSVQLVGVGNGAPLWAKTFDASAGGVFELQDSLSKQLAQELQLRLTQQEQARLTQRATRSPKAYEHYIRGRYFWNRRTEEGLSKAIDSFRQAITLDPTYALAYAGVADSYVLLPLFGSVPPSKAFPEAIQAAEAALRLDPELAEAETSLAYSHFFYNWKLEAAERGFRRAIELNPSYPTAHQWYAFLLSALGRHPEGIEHAERAVELDPLSLVINTDLGMTLAFARQFDRAVAQFKKTLELDPSFAYGHYGLGYAHQLQGRPSEAIDEFRLAVVHSNGSVATRAALGQGLAAAGRTDEARAILRDLEAEARRGFVDASQLAQLYTMLGEKERALAALERASEERSRFVLFLATWGIYDSLRAEPRFDALITKVGLPR